MVFASGIFLFLFLPVTFIGYWLLKNKPIEWRNIFLLMMSLGFYLRSGIKELVLLMCSITVNYMLARMISIGKRRFKKLFLFIAVSYNIGMLFIFKYLSFAVSQISAVTSLDMVLDIALPLGISFYTFQALSYVIDVYRNHAYVEKNFFNVALYITLFPQLVAGPIVRWDSIREELHCRKSELDKGFSRFAIGLGKKVIIANQMAVLADKAFALLSTGELTTAFAWLGIAGYTLQIYYDFSGYSDMAIGLGSIFGFHFLENFNYPYISKSITEFWRRWHISLSTWFRDYVYIPLGGNRCSPMRRFMNLFAVWMFTGFWHGANYTFWLWGLVYFVILVIEKQFLSKKTYSHSSENWMISIIQHSYTMLMVMCLWVVFRAESVGDAVNYIKHMFGASAETPYAMGVTRLYFQNYWGYILVAILGCIPLGQVVQNKLNLSEKTADYLAQIWTVLIFVIACAVTIDSNYNPFIYFNF